jgi:hypothetical protein
MGTVRQCRGDAPERSHAGVHQTGKEAKEEAGKEAGGREEAALSLNEKGKVRGLQRSSLSMHSRARVSALLGAFRTRIRQIPKATKTFTSEGHPTASN